METACKRAESARFHVAYFIRTNTLRGKNNRGKNVCGFDFQKIVIRGTNVYGFAKNLRLCGKNVFLSEKEVEILLIICKQDLPFSSSLMILQGFHSNKFRSTTEWYNS